MAILDCNNAISVTQVVDLSGKKDNVAYQIQSQ